MKSNNVMLITGATSGVGKALAEYYYKKNYKLILVGGTKEKVDKQSKKFKKNTLFICADLTKSKDVKRIVSESITKFKKIDILIANAGLYEPDKILSGSYNPALAIKISIFLNLVIDSLTILLTSFDFVKSAQINNVFFLNFFNCLSTFSFEPPTSINL